MIWSYGALILRFGGGDEGGGVYLLVRTHTFVTNETDDDCWGEELSKKGRKLAGVFPFSLLDDFACCESLTDRVDLSFHVIARFGLRNKDYEAFYSGYSVSTTADFFYVKVVLLAFLNWLLVGTFIADAFHLVQCVQLVLRRKT